MSLQERLDAALSIIREHNQTFLTDPDTTTLSEGCINPDQFLINIKHSGGTSEERLRSMSYEDIIPCLIYATISTSEKTTQIKPVALARAIAREFRSYRPENTTQNYISAIKADRMTPTELLQAFNPEEPDSPVGKRLSTISKGEPFLVYTIDRTLDTINSFKLLMETKQGFKGRNKIQIGQGDIKRVYKVGELPDNLVDENPIYPGRPLRPDGTCDQTSRSWDGVAQRIRQLVRIITNGKNITMSEAHDIIDRAIKPTAWEDLSNRFQTETLKFLELERTGAQPQLKIPLRSETANGMSSLEGGRKVNPR